MPGAGCRPPNAQQEELPSPVCHPLPAPAAITAAASGAISFGSRFVDIDGASTQLRAVQSRNGFFSFFSVGHFHEPESARTPSFAVGQYAYPVYLAVCLESLA